MSDTESAFAGVPAEDLEELLEAGRASGTLSMASVMFVFKDVDPTPDVIHQIKDLLAKAGIAFEEDEPGEAEQFADHGHGFAAAAAEGPAVLEPAVLDSAVADAAVLDAALLNPAVLDAAVLDPVLLNPAILEQALVDPAGLVAAVLDAAVVDPATLDSAVLDPALIDPTLLEPAVLEPAPRLTSRERIDASRASRLDTKRAAEPGGDPVRMYLKEIGQVALLNSAQEIAIAQRIEAGLLADEELERLADEECLDSLTPKRRDQLNADSRDGHRAQTQLTQANLRLVVSIAKRYGGRGMALLDLIQEGNLGLMRAVQKFDHRKGFKFSTYATWWIRQAITRSIADQARTIRIPVHMVETMNRVKRTQRDMHQQLERNPTVDELAEECDLTPERIREILRISLDPLSLDTPVGSEDDANLSDFIRDDRLEAPADVAARRFLGDAVLEVLDELNEREQEVVRLRFGLDGGRPHTLEEVGKAFGVTRERIRQIEAKTLAKLRHPHRSEKLRGYLEGS